MILLQSKSGAAFKFTHIYFDPIKKLHVAWYEPLKEASFEEELARAEGALNESD